ncbi:ABC transporter substrate-binding protein [Otariodibacter sp.]|uniref:ABC transporter substrate-binding protein n=1 Tax=Otariodibacter sp. TaxID=3030919 RepID=UPI0026239511|nr:ABC transporter substrate-binding protein [Otariodibacter sp.]
MQIRYLLGILLISLGFSTSTFSAVVPNGTKLAKNQEIVINNSTEPQSIDPHKFQGVPEAQVIYQLFEGLVTVDSSGNILPGTAESWSHNNDFKQWTFKLRSNAKWSNGDPVTAYDFVYSWRRLADPKTGSLYASYLNDLQVINAQDIIKGKKNPADLGVKALDDHTFQVSLVNSIPYFTSMLFHPAVLAVPQKIVEKKGDDWIKIENFVGNGPYKLADHVVNEKIVFERNPLYWNDEETVINKAIFLSIVNGSTDLQRYRAGDIDITSYGLPTEQFSKLKKEVPNELFISKVLSTYSYEINNQKEPFNNVKVREALNLSLDRKIITDKVLAQGEIPTYVFTPTYISEGEKIRQPEYSKLPINERNKKAVKLLEEAGYSKSNPLKFTLLYNTSENHKKIAIAAASIWKNNTQGLVEVSLENQEWKTYLDSRRLGNYDIARAGWSAGYNQAATFINYFLSNATSNTAFYKNDEYDRLANSAYQAINTDVRSEIYAKAEDILAKDFGTIPVYNYVNVRLVKPYVKGYEGKDPLDNILLKNLYLISKEN